jgi:DNA-binding transcriptional MerR regulator
VTEYRIDELARASGVTVRNIRYYQDRGMLPPPRRQGRVGLYRDAHLVRLRLITRLLERGYTAASITELLSAWERGRELSEVLGLEHAVTANLEQEVPESITHERLHELFALPPSGQSDLVERVLAAEIATRESPGTLRVLSPRLLHAAAGLVTEGAPLDAAIRLIGGARAAMEAAVREFVLAFADEVLTGREPGWMPTSEEAVRYSRMLDRLRPVVISAMSAALAGSLARNLDDVFGQFVDRFLPTVTSNDPGILSR